MVHPQLKAQGAQEVTPLAGVSLRQGIQADLDSGKISRGRTLLCLFSLGRRREWGPILAFWFVLGCPGGVSCPSLRPGTAICL